MLREGYGFGEENGLEKRWVGELDGFGEGTSMKGDHSEEGDGLIDENGFG